MFADPERACGRRERAEDHTLCLLPGADTSHSEDLEGVDFFSLYLAQCPFRSLLLYHREWQP